MSILNVIAEFIKSSLCVVIIIYSVGFCACLSVVLYRVVVAVTRVLSYSSILIFMHQNILHIHSKVLINQTAKFWVSHVLRLLIYTWFSLLNIVPGVVHLLHECCICDDCLVFCCGFSCRRIICTCTLCSLDFDFCQLHLQIFPLKICLLIMWPCYDAGDNLSVLKWNYGKIITTLAFCHLHPTVLHVAYLYLDFAYVYVVSFCQFMWNMLNK